MENLLAEANELVAIFAASYWTARTSGRSEKDQWPDDPMARWLDGPMAR
jgi:hypothetical protein